MDITIKVIPNEQIKEREGFTGADWWFDSKDDSIQVRVAKMGDWREEFALAIHEVVEAAFCRYDGIPVSKVDEFDRENEGDNHGLNAGDMPNAPYRIQHCYATAVERMIAGYMNIWWGRYDERLGKL